ncbi:MAG: hypothetical protein M1830_010565 [Pleopsidium flavum]|nr:MAG: hypothetical protein M1830_010565 [Pleopsidium flavum]
MAVAVDLKPLPMPPSSDNLPGTKSPLFDYRLVDPSINALKFDAAASYQLPSAHSSDCTHAKNDFSEDLLVVSPYTSRAHLLDLNTVSKPNQLLAKSLTTMKPVREDYATASYDKAFNWGSIMDVLQTLIREEGYEWKEESFYVVVFKSRVPPTTDKSHLGRLDEKSHEEAMASGGLLKYWFGNADPDTGRNLATCIWRNRADAKRGGAGEGHRRAMRATVGLYTEWKFERLKLIIQEGGKEWDIVEWQD